MFISRLHICCFIGNWTSVLVPCFVCRASVFIIYQLWIVWNCQFGSWIVKCVLYQSVSYWYSMSFKTFTFGGKVMFYWIAKYHYRTGIVKIWVLIAPALWAVFYFLHLIWFVLTSQWPCWWAHVLANFIMSLLLVNNCCWCDGLKLNSVLLLVCCCLIVITWRWIFKLCIVSVWQAQSICVRHAMYIETEHCLWWWGNVLVYCYVSVRY
jgi:hypothetical protein